MKTIILTLFFLYTTTLSAQDSTTVLSRVNYLELKHFLLSQKSADRFTNIHSKLNSKLFRQQFQEWYIMAKKKELAKAILVDNRQMIQTMPADVNSIMYGSKDLIWISPAKRYGYQDSPAYINASFGEQVKQDIINDIGNGLINSKRRYRYRYSAANNQPYKIPSFLKF
ncbi:MAG: hypothetical protein ABI741_11190 [Ferruginibacter sp.]